MYQLSVRAIHFQGVNGLQAGADMDGEFLRTWGIGPQSSGIVTR